jgi:hypothetical protein
MSILDKLDSIEIKTDKRISEGDFSSVRRTSRLR